MPSITIPTSTGPRWGDSSFNSSTSFAQGRQERHRHLLRVCRLPCTESGVDDQVDFTFKMNRNDRILVQDAAIRQQHVEFVGVQGNAGLEGGFHRFLRHRHEVVEPDGVQGHPAGVHRDMVPARPAWQRHEQLLRVQRRDRQHFSASGTSSTRTRLLPCRAINSPSVCNRPSRSEPRVAG